MTIEHFSWDDERYSIGNRLIDHQHRQLMGMVNEMIDLAAEAEPDEGHYLQLLIRLNEYVQTHFQVEESLMRQAEYAELEAHINSHEQLSSQASRLILNPNVGQVQEAAALLRSWLENHVLYEDMLLKPALGSGQ